MAEYILWPVSEIAYHLVDLARIDFPVALSIHMDGHAL